jgi:hypothetical protein
MAAASFTPSARAGQIFFFSDVSGLSAEAEFTLLDSTTLEIRLANTSTGVPGGFDSSDQLLTGVSWDFGEPGFNGDVMITGGSVVIGPTSASLDFDAGAFGAGADVSGEYGYGNMDGTGALINFVSANTAASTPFGGANLDGPASIDGPQAGLVADPVLVPLGGLGAIQHEIIATLTLSEAYTEAELLHDLFFNAVRVEFGSDAFFITTIPIPEPATMTLFAIGATALIRRTRRT